MKVAVLKPDHLGDFVLAAPALAALQRRFNDLTLLCHPDTVPLARHLFPNLILNPLLLPHLDRERRVQMSARPLDAIRDAFDLIICLRWDACIKAHLDDAGINYQSSEQDILDVHVAIEQHDAIAAWTGNYDVATSYIYNSPPTLPRRLRSVGLCISAGFPLNAWPLNHWLLQKWQLKRQLQRQR